MKTRSTWENRAMEMNLLDLYGLTAVTHKHTHTQSARLDYCHQTSNESHNVQLMFSEITGLLHIMVYNVRVMTE